MKNPFIPKIIRRQKRKFNIKSSDTRRYVGQTVASFSGMIIALSWNDLIQNFVDVLKEEYPILSLFGGTFAAILLTIVAVGLGILFLNSIDSRERKMEMNVDASRYWKIDFFNRLKSEHIKTRYFTLSEVENRIFNQMNCKNGEYQDNKILFTAEDEFHHYNIELIPIEKSEYEKNTEKPMPVVADEKTKEETA
jgi:hypothetical protein